MKKEKGFLLKEIILPYHHSDNSDSQSWMLILALNEVSKQSY